MKIDQVYRAGRTALSFEVFPPKKDEETDLMAMYGVLSELAELKPDFMSVTYGAGGSASAKRKTVEIAQHIKKSHALPSIAHMTCIGLDNGQIKTAIDCMVEAGIENVLALRGDLPAGMELSSSPYVYAEDLILAVREYAPDICVGAACYPEGHIDCGDMDASLDHLKRKQDAGANFFLGQLCFDNELFYRFLDRASACGITLPVSAGVMPILSRGQIEQMIFMCGASLPSKIIKLLHKYADDPKSLSSAGIEYAMDQVRNLCESGVDGVHIYTMNRPTIARKCAEAIGR